MLGVGWLTNSDEVNLNSQKYSQKVVKLTLAFFVRKTKLYDNVCSSGG